VSDFSLDINPGEIMCLLGNNGAGKTTIINLITGLIENDQDAAIEADVKIFHEMTVVSLKESIKEFRNYIRLCQ